jgi:cation diffusion facilitator family transporter
LGQDIKNSDSKIIIKVSIVSIVLNLILSISKLVSGLVFDNFAVFSDGVDSATDVLTAIVIIVTVFLSSPKTDKDHNYGHEKTESIVTLLFSLALFGLVYFLINKGITGLIYSKQSSVNPFLIAVTIISIAVKEAMFWYKIYYAKKIKSDILKADAWNNRTDSLTSVCVLIGLFLNTFLGSSIFESIAVLIVSVFVFKVALQIFLTAIGQLRDKAADDSIVQKIRFVTLSVKGVHRVDSLQTRIFGKSIFVDLEIAVDGEISVNLSHNIAQNVHDQVESISDVNIKHCTVHVNPYCEIQSEHFDSQLL